MQRLSRHVFVETDVDTVVFPPRPDMRRPLVDLLRDGPLSSQTIEDALAKRFCVTEKMRAALHQSNCPAWRNHVAWVLVDLGRTGSGEIERIEGKPRPGGGSMGIYRLMSL
jgi:hypothetical protein